MYPIAAFCHIQSLLVRFHQALGAMLGSSLFDSEDILFSNKIQISFPQIKDNGILGRHYSLPEESLPHIITSVEKKLGNPITDNPCIHLVVYIPPCETSPLHIYNKHRQRRSTNDVESFISVNWGGIVIQNPDAEICSKYLEMPGERVNIEIRSEHVMQVIIQLLRKIIDIEVNVSVEKIEIEPKNVSLFFYVARFQ